MEAASSPADPAAGYPARLTIAYEEQLNRWLPLVKWLLLIPHYIALFILYFAAWFALIGAAFVVLFTGRYPPGLFGFQAGVIRWTMRVYAYGDLMTDHYPPFSLEKDPNSPVQLEIEYPEEVERWRPFVAWLLAIPYMIAVSIIHYIAALLVFFAFFTILFTRRFPRGMFDIVEVALRWAVRGWAYAAFMVTRYPPWVWG
ncbi:MAG TPA: DUF4389 domain-containing protein [Thermoleophilaceae bacterium]|jgi:hypothetical protein